MLRQEQLTTFDLAEILGIKEKEIADHLEHVAKTVKASLRIEPARCRQCGFVFSRKKQFKSPSRCPECHGQQIERPRFSIR